MLIPMVVFTAACAGLAYFGLHKSSSRDSDEKRKAQMEIVFPRKESAQTKT